MIFNDRIVFAVVLASISIYLFSQHDQGWIAHDEGLLGQAATRVLDGEVPHVDFDDPYTGGLAVAHAATMRVFGVHSRALRILLLIASTCAAAITYWIARRIASPPVAAMLTWLTVAWGVANYFAPLPSWFNLFFAIGGVAALLRFDESSKRRWLMLAGVCGGLSFLVKVAGLYFIAAGLLFLVYREQCRATLKPVDAPEKRPIAFYAFTTVCLIAFTAALLLLIRRRLTAMDAIHFVWPGCALASFLIVRQLTISGSSVDRLWQLTKTIGLFVGGALIPVAIFLAWIAAASGTSGLTMFFEGVFVLPQKRIEFADYPLPPLGALPAMIPIASLLVIPMLMRRKMDPLWLATIAWIGCVMGWFIASQSPLYESIWSSVRTLIPLVVTVGVVKLWGRAPVAGDNVLFLLLATAAMVSLVQFPYSFPIYFCYAASIGILAFAAIVQSNANQPRHLTLVVAIFYLGFGLLVTNQSRVQRMGTQHVRDDQTVALDLPRSGLRVSALQARLYEGVVKEIERHSGPGDFIYATMDCPEIYFLADRRNPTRSFYDFFETDFSGDVDQRSDRIMGLLREKEVDVVVLHWRGEFSGGVSQEFAERLVVEYPNAVHFVSDPANAPHAEPVFSVAWREGPR